MRWAILGPGLISRDFVAGLRASTLGELVAVGSSSPQRAAAFAREFGAGIHGSYDDILRRDDIDACYVGTVHTTHADLAVASLLHGKAVLCEKPAGLDLAEVDHILEAARRAQRPFLEAFKNRFGPFADALRDLVGGGSLGAPLTCGAACGFDAGAPTGRLFDPAVGGGAVLDVGCYPMSLAVEVASAAGIPLAAAEALAGRTTRVGDVEADTSAEIRWPGFTAGVRTSIIESLPRSATLQFTDGAVQIPDAWGSRAASATEFTLSDGARRQRLQFPTVQPMAAEADALLRALREDRLEVPEMPWEHSRTIASLLASWRAQALRPAAGQDIQGFTPRGQGSP